MAEILTDAAIDFSAYLRETEASVKVRPASLFAQELRSQFAERKRDGKVAEMFSTKLRNCIEFRPGEVTVWAGYNGHRKSMFTGQVALDLCVQGQRTLMASFEMQPAATLARMARQAYGMARPSPEQLDGFSEWTDGRLWMFDHVGTISPEQCLAVARFFADERKGQQVVIDSMMMVCASEESLDEQKRFMTATVRMAQETGLHIHVVAHCRKPASGDERAPSKYDIRGSAALSDQAHNVITIWSNLAKLSALQLSPTHPDHMKALEQPDAVVTIAKQRNGAFEGKRQLWFDERSFRFLDDRGSPVEPYAIGGNQCLTRTN